MFLFLGKSKDVVTPLIKKIKEYVKRNPVKASLVIRFWLKTDQDKLLNEANLMKALMYYCHLAKMQPLFSSPNLIRKIFMHLTRV